jgi:hypothetical protein
MSDETSGNEAERTNANRRRFLKGLGALSVVGLAGCGGDDGDACEALTGEWGNLIMTDYK